MDGLLTDTHALIWYLQLSPRLSAKARISIKDTITAGSPVYVSSVSMVEIAYLEDKGRVPVGTFDRILQADRMIAATALHLNLPLVTADRKIQSAPLLTIW